MDTKKRIVKWDNTKAFLIICVIMGHLCDIFMPYSIEKKQLLKSCFLFIYSFHMPAFLFVSGLFQKREKSKSPFPFHRLFYLLLLGYSLKYLLFLLGNQLFPKSNFHFDFFGDGSLPWFLFVLSFYMIITYIIRKVPVIIVLVSSIALSCVAGYNDAINDFLYLSRLIVFFPFYYIGYCITPFQAKDFFQKKYIIVLSIFTLILFGILCFTDIDTIYPYRYLFTGRHPYDAVSIPNCGYINRLISYAFSVILSICVISLIPNINLGLFTYIGKNTLSIYFWHYPVLWLLYKANILSNRFLEISPFVLFLVSTVIALFLSIPIWSIPLNMLKRICYIFQKKTATGKVPAQTPHNPKETEQTEQQKPVFEKIT